MDLACPDFLADLGVLVDLGCLVSLADLACLACLERLGLLAGLAVLAALANLAVLAGLAFPERPAVLAFQTGRKSRTVLIPKGSRVLGRGRYCEQEIDKRTPTWIPLRREGIRLPKVLKGPSKGTCSRRCWS